MAAAKRRRGRSPCSGVLVLAALFLSLPGRAAFVDVTDAVGISYLHHSANPAFGCLVLDGAFCTPERMAGGAAVADVDGDGDLDLYATRLEAAGLLFCNQLADRGEAVFEDCTATAGLDAGVNGNGAAFGDVDRDGDPDLYVSAIATTRFYLFMNDGAGHFSEEGVARGAAVETPYVHLGFGVELGDYDGDGWLDIHVNEWGTATVKYSGGVPAQPVHMRLLRNRGFVQPGFFDDATEAAGVSIPDVEAWGFSSALRDLDSDGNLDLAIASDFGTSKLFWNDGDGTFTEGGAAAGVATDENGMGSSFGDADNNATLDWFVTSIYDPGGPCPQHPNCPFGSTGNRLYHNWTDRQFTDQTGDAASGLRDGGWGWGTAFFDYDLDGDLDLVMTNGVDYPDTTSEDAYNADPMRLWRNDGDGAWTEVAAAEGITEQRPGTGLLVFDYDADGDLDVFVVHNASTPVLYANQAVQPGGPHWLRVRLVRPDGPNTDAFGATLTVIPLDVGPLQTRVIGSSTNFLAWSDPAAHFGLGASNGPALVAVGWPGGLVEGELVADFDRTLTLVPESAAAGAALAALAALRVLVRSERRG